MLECNEKELKRLGLPVCGFPPPNDKSYQFLLLLLRLWLLLLWIFVMALNTRTSIKFPPSLNIALHIIVWVSDTESHFIGKVMVYYSQCRQTFKHFILLQSHETLVLASTFVFGVLFFIVNTTNWRILCLDQIIHKSFHSNYRITD